MIISERVIKDLRSGKKEALEEVFLIYEPLYHFLYAQIVFNEKWVNQQMPLFYQEMYQKIANLSDDCLFEKWSLRLLVKHAQVFLHDRDELKGMNDDEIHDILKEQYHSFPVIKYLDDDENLIGVLSLIYHLPCSFISKLFNYKKYSVFLAKKNVQRVINKTFPNDSMGEYKKAFLDKYDGGLSFEDVSKDIVFEDRSVLNKNYISGPIRTLIIVIVVVIIIISVFWLIHGLKGNSPVESGILKL